jgi:hypothetical protein
MSGYVAGKTGKPIHIGYISLTLRPMNAMIARLDRSRHKSYLLRILLDVSRDPVLNKCLVFKG